jgi:hypothetical protein
LEALVYILVYSLTLKLMAMIFSETLVDFQRATRSCISEEIALLMLQKLRILAVAYVFQFHFVKVK